MVDYAFPRTYGLAKSLDLLCVFEKSNAFDAEWILFHLKDMGLYTGELKFRFKPQDINNTPNLKL
jgi:hypothetical protein